MFSSSVFCTSAEPRNALKRSSGTLMGRFMFPKHRESSSREKGADKGKTYEILHTRFKIYIYIHVCVLQIISVYTVHRLL